MVVIAEFRLTDGDLPLLRPLRAVPDAAVTLDAIVPFAGDPLPYVWVEGDQDAFEAALRADPKVESVAVETRHDGRALYRVTWAPETHELLGVLAAAGGSLLAGTGDATGWRYQLRFPSHEGLGEYVTRCDDLGLDAELRRVYSLAAAGADGRLFGLTPKEREALELAGEGGYFASPRRTSLDELASELDISPQALSQRVRRGVRKLVTNCILVGDAAAGR